MKRRNGAFSSFTRCESGSAAVEFAFIGMLLIAASLAVIDFGRAFYLYNKMTNAVERAARRSLVFEPTNAQLIEEIMKDFPKSSSPDQSEIPKVTVTTGAEFRTVKVDMIFRPIVPAFVASQYNLTFTRRFPKAS